MFCNCLAVGAGGALGAVCRYGMSLLPVLQRGAFLFYLQGQRAQRNIRAAFHTCVEAADALQERDPDLAGCPATAGRVTELFTQAADTLN